jgi:hypothetical protein
VNQQEVNVKFAGILSLLILTGCVSGTIANNGRDIEGFTGDATESTDDFDVQIEQTTTPMVMPGTIPGPVDVKYSITVANRTKEPIHLSQVDLRSVGGETPRIDVTTRKFNKTIEPGAKATLEYWATVHVRDATIGAAGPMVIRTQLHLEAGEAKRLESFTRRVNGRLSIGVGG